MQRRLLRLCAAALAVAGFVGFGPRASAELITLNYLGPTDHPGNPTLQVYNNPTTFTNASVGPFYWAQNQVPSNNNFDLQLATFCIELKVGQPLPSTGDNATFTVLPLSSLTNLSASASAIEELYGRYYQSAWNDQSTFHGSVDSAAFQLALWELAFDGPTSKDLGSGNFQASGLGAYTTDAQNMLNSLNGSNAFQQNLGNYELVALLAPSTSDPSKAQDQIQDQLTLRPKAVPAPPAFMLAGVGVLALLGRARWNRKTA